jgi:hypothetical protein
MRMRLELGLRLQILGFRVVTPLGRPQKERDIKSKRLFRVVLVFFFCVKL